MSRTPRSRARTRHAIVLAFALTPVVAGTVDAAVSGPPPFSSSSPFNLLLPSQLKIAGNQGGLSGAGRSISYGEWTPAVYVASSGDPAYTIRIGDTRSPLNGRSVRIPRNAKPAPDQDGHMTIVQPDGTVISLWQASSGPSGSNWYATGGGIAYLSGDGGNWPNAAGGRESGISQLAGLITPDDVRRGIAAGANGDLGHALAVGYGQVSNSKKVPPAVRAGGNSGSSSALWMGQKIYLDPTLDLNKVSWSGSSQNQRFGRLVARTLQRWGAIVVTNTGGNLNFQLVNPRSWTSIGQSDPWPGLIGSSGGGYYGFTIKNLPGSAFKALDPYAVGVKPSGGTTTPPPPTTQPPPPPTTQPPPVTGTTGNLVANPSFESSTSGWGGWQATIARTALSGAPDGAYVVKVAWTAGTSFTIDDAADTVPSVTGGATYTAAAYARAASTSSVGKTISIKVRERNSAGALVAEWSQSVTLSNSFARVAVSAAAKASGDSLDVRLSQGSAASGDAFYADAISLTRS